MCHMAPSPQKPPLRIRATASPRLPTRTSNAALVNPLNLRPSSTVANQPAPTASCHSSGGDAPNRQQQGLDSGPASIHLPAKSSMAEVRLFGLPVGAFSSARRLFGLPTGAFSSITRPLVPPTAKATAAGAATWVGQRGGGKRKRVLRGSGARQETLTAAAAAAAAAPCWGASPTTS